MEPGDIVSIINDAGTISLAISVLALMVKGTLIPQSVVKSIVADTTRAVLEKLECPLVNVSPK